MFHEVQQNFGKILPFLVVDHLQIFLLFFVNKIRKEKKSLYGINLTELRIHIRSLLPKLCYTSVNATLSLMRIDCMHGSFISNPLELLTNIRGSTVLSRATKGLSRGFYSVLTRIRISVAIKSYVLYSTVSLQDLKSQCIFRQYSFSPDFDIYLYYG